MRNKLIALVAMAAAGAATAQSSVTLYGVVDTTLMLGSGSTADRVRLGGSGLSSNRVGFRGTEDLGDGMFAKFVLEAGFNSDDGTGSRTNTNNQSTGSSAAPAGTQGLTFNRASWLSIGGRWGELRLGRQYTPVYISEWYSDPFGQNGVGTAVFATAGASFNTLTGVRASNMINYFLPANLGGFNGEVAYYLGENLQDGAATENDGRGYSGRLGYTAGPVNVQTGYGRTNYATGDVVMSNVSASYDFQVAKAFAGYVRNKVGAARSNGWIVGATVPVGAGEIRTSYSTHETDAGADPRQRQIALGYVHNLSKRTALYSTFARVKNSGGSALALNGAATAPNTSSNGLDLGLRHSF